MLAHLVIAVALALAPITAHAATMEVDHECTYEPNCSYIFVQGVIEKGDAERFKKMLKQEKVGANAVVALHSPGGIVEDGIAIGLLVHERGFLTLVGDDARCVSMCADIWLAGKVRYVSETGHIGFHATSVREAKTHKYVGPCRECDQLSRAYFQRIGLTETAIRYLMAAKGDDVTWLDGDKAYEIGIIATALKPIEKDEPEEKQARCQDGNGRAVVCGGEGPTKRAEAPAVSKKCAFDLLSSAPDHFVKDCD
jgi:hypothetical protein